jgi:hypothetical protein
MEKDKWVSFVSKLLEFTQKRHIRWQISNDLHFLPADERATHAYLAEFMDKKLRLYRFQHRIDDDRWFSQRMLRDALGISMQRDRGESGHWVERTKLEIVDDSGLSLFEVPGVVGIGDLLTAVRYQTADIDQYLDKVTAATAG